jgi:REP element-mobilizing transposase RayT
MLNNDECFVGADNIRPKNVGTDNIRSKNVGTDNIRPKNVGADNIRPKNVGADNIRPQRKVIRLKNYDYSQSGLYFITICAQDKKCLFGYIINGKMFYNKIGNIVLTYLLEIPNHFPNVKIHDNIIMPNHLHFILEIDNYEPTKIEDIKLIDTNAGGCYPPLQAPHINSRNVSSIIRGFKQGVFKQFKKSIFQRGFYEHIIRSDESLENIQGYIYNNPMNWELDKLYIM